jgi:hypothetical protein
MREKEGFRGPEHDHSTHIINISLAKVSKSRLKNHFGVNLRKSRLSKKIRTRYPDRLSSGSRAVSLPGDPLCSIPARLIP